MSIFKKKSNPVFFEEGPVDEKYSTLSNFVSTYITSKADLNKTIDALEHIYIARQKLANVKTDDDTINESTKFMLHEKEAE